MKPTAEDELEVSAAATDGAAVARAQAEPPPQPPEHPSATERRYSTRPSNGHPTRLVERRTAHRDHSRSTRSQLRAFRRATVALALVLIGVTMAWITMWAKLGMSEADNLALDLTLHRTKQEVEELRLALAKREQDLIAAVENRIPGMQSLEYNKLLDVRDRYVLNINFAESGVGDSKKLEYHATLRNDTTDLVLPNVTIYLFDQFGMEVGEARLDKSDATQDFILEELRAGETRSYHEAIDVKRNAVPLYYMIHIE